MASLRTLDNALTVSLLVLAFAANGHAFCLVSHADGRVVSSLLHKVEHDTTTHPKHP
jgi:hypothetical protein